MCAHLFHRLQRNQRSLQDLIEFLQKSIVVTPGLLKKAMASNCTDSVIQSIKDFQVQATHSKGLVMVQGVVESESPLRSLLNHTTRLVLSTVSSEQLMSNTTNYVESEGKIITRMVNDFTLKDIGTNGDSIEINNQPDAHYAPALNSIHSIEHTRNLSPIEQFLNWILFCFRLFLSMNSMGNKDSGFKVGTRRLEKGILVGQFLIAFGEVVFDKATKRMFMNNPGFFSKDKEQLLKTLQESNAKLARNMTLIMTGLMIFGVLLAKRLFQLFRRLVKKWFVGDTLPNGKMDPLSHVKKITADDFRCFECQEGPRSVIFHPCLHMTVCFICEAKSPQQRCQVCLKEVEEATNLYVV